MATNHPENISDEGRKVFLHNPDDKETDGVYFGVNLQQQDGRFVFKDFVKGRLAYKTGFRSGDMLVSANSIDIGKVDLMQLLKELLDYKEFNYIIGIERKLDDGTNTFIWKIFKITTKDGVPDVAVLETLENDTDLMPDASFTPSTPTYDFIRVTGQSYNIYIEDGQAPTKYLTINGNKQLVFQDYNESSKFFRYSYTDPAVDPKKGAVMALSLYDSWQQGVSSSPATSKNLKDTKVLQFPQYMTGNNIPPDAHFWYTLIVKGAFTMQSMIAPGKYLGIGSGDKAILTTTATTLLISQDEGVAKPKPVE
ncbi:uncharacterized protein LOC117295764 [Asterias rubens]|uniref:uncharacterized protein LOC117295764 n=1 Tax=Asterias rubens TaxID=7604 RepID=UPI0014556296|nr:uncharacterized protein LOC117295764 [Asterias rubens]